MDTNGAGDAFVGGFLAALSKGKDMEVLRPRVLCPEKWGCQGEFIGEKHGESLMILWIFMGYLVGLTGNQQGLAGQSS